MVGISSLPFGGISLLLEASAGLSRALARSWNFMGCLWPVGSYYETSGSLSYCMWTADNCFWVLPSITMRSRDTLARFSENLRTQRNLLHSSGTMYTLSRGHYWCSLNPRALLLRNFWFSQNRTALSRGHVTRWNGLGPACSRRSMDVVTTYFHEGFRDGICRKRWRLFREDCWFFHEAISWGLSRNFMISCERFYLFHEISSQSVPILHFRLPKVCFWFRET